MKTFVIYPAIFLVVMYGSTKIIKDVAYRIGYNEARERSCKEMADDLKTMRQLADSAAAEGEEGFSSTRQISVSNMETVYRRLCVGYGPQL